MFRYYFNARLSKFAATLAVLVVSASLTQCANLLGEDDNDDNAVAVAALAALGVSASAPCVIGGVTFTKSGSITCGTNLATGTGTLTAATNRTDVVSMQLTFQLLSSTSQLSSFSGVSNSGTIGTSTGAELRITPLTAKSAADAATGATGPGVLPATWCLEHHVDENPKIHVVIDRNSCTPKASTAASYETTETTTRNGGLWGFSLNNATITAMSLNSSRLFTD